MAFFVRSIFCDDAGGIDKSPSRPVRVCRVSGLAPSLARSLSAEISALSSSRPCFPHAPVRLIRHAGVAVQLHPFRIQFAHLGPCALLVLFADGNRPKGRVRAKRIRISLAGSGEWPGVWRSSSGSQPPSALSSSDVSEDRL